MIIIIINNNINSFKSMIKVYILFILILRSIFPNNIYCIGKYIPKVIK